MTPVAASEAVWKTLILSAGLAISPMFAITRHHLKAGAQKKMVFGPAGWLRNWPTFVARAMLLIFLCVS